MWPPLSFRGTTKIGALIIAAGMSSRMRAFKPLLPIGQDTLIQCALKRLQEADVETIVIVTGNNAELLQKHLTEYKVTFVTNHHYANTEMFDSILLGIQELEGKCDAFFLLPADIPMFRPESLVTMIETLGKSNRMGVSPTYKGKTGHPVLFAEKSIHCIRSHDGTDGLKGAIKGMDITNISLDDEGILHDADTQEDYQNLCKYRWNSIPTEGEIQEIYNYVLHDAANNIPNYAEGAANMIAQMGYGKVAELVRMHMKVSTDSVYEAKLFAETIKTIIGRREQ